ncbi:MAG TPA: hypothetical protein VFS52_17915 [Steroidobacteraceae bacterium]|jgi:hypothetical protein|nr:hypothetical protein [Steroidobacteraceae bacterium]
MDLYAIAVFPDRDAAQLAEQALHDRGIAGERMRISAGCVLHVRVASVELDDVTTQLRTTGALQVTCDTRSNDPGWMSRIGEALTGAQVMPGAGDAEAGWSRDGPD